MALGYASEELKGKESVVLKAVEKDGTALRGTRPRSLRARSPSS
jgi:hypothetical protein